MHTLTKSFVLCLVKEESTEENKQKPGIDRKGDF
jgi:hypothetical protein